MEKKIATVIVTYNRKDLLKRCLDAVSQQTFKPATVYITDNASTDGTLGSVKEWNYYECEKNGIQYKYIHNSKNEGGAGGFYLGMKTAFEDDSYDGVWVMDDDGVPDNNCLSVLVKYLDNRDYIAPCVLSIENPKVGFGIDHPNYEEVKAQYPDGVIEGVSAPFNGILYSSTLIKTIGYPKREMFIWGDETNYHLRAIKANMPPITVLRAIHYHPFSKQVQFEYGKRKYVDIDTKWKLYCFLRNKWYNTLRLSNRNYVRSSISVILDALRYIIAYKIIKRRNIGYLVIDALVCSFEGNFDRLSKYMKKDEK